MRLVRRPLGQHLPADPATVAAFLAAQAHAGIKASSIGRRLAAIRYGHRLRDGSIGGVHPRNEVSGVRLSGRVV